ncbi:MAG: acetyl-CoA carboxylase biotin carboxyl carrier protein [Chitinophagales bacterium]
MTFKQIQDLIKLVSKSDLGELKIEQDNFKISLKTKDFIGKTLGVQQSPVVQTTPVASAPAETNSNGGKSNSSESPKETEENTSTESEKTADSSNYITVKSPMIGTFYRSASPDKPPFIKVGDTISKGQVTCIVEAMKLFNEIESEVEGKVVKILVEDASPVEYDQELFLIDPL